MGKFTDEVLLNFFEIRASLYDKEVFIYNPKTKKNLLLKKVGGYDPSGQYISIQHKGQYVKSIKYITRKQFMQAKE